MTKARRTLSPFDITKDEGIEKRKVYGLLRRKSTPAAQSSTPVASAGVSGANGITGAPGVGGTSGSSSGVLVKRIAPQTHVNDTSDGIAVGWCPNGARTQFVIQDSDVISRSVVTANAASVNGADNYADRTAIQVQLINYTDGTYGGFLITCSIAPVSTDNLNYAIFNAPPTNNLTLHQGNAIGGGFYNDTGVTNTLNTGKVYAMKIGAQEGLKKDALLESVGVRSGAAGGHIRFKIYQDAVSCGVIPFSLPGALLTESDSIPILNGWTDVSVSLKIPHDAYYNGAAGCGANNPDVGAVWIGIEVDSSVPIGYFPTTPFFGYTYGHNHSYGAGAPSFNYPTDINTDAYNVRLLWGELLP